MYRIYLAAARHLDLYHVVYVPDMRVVRFNESKVGALRLAHLLNDHAMLQGATSR